MPKLKTEINTPEMEARILDAAEGPLNPPHALNFSADFEHGQWWVTCAACGAQWSVVDANTPSGFDFEAVSEGDSYCQHLFVGTP